MYRVQAQGSLVACKMHSRMLRATCELRSVPMPIVSLPLAPCTVSMDRRHALLGIAALPLVFWGCGKGPRFNATDVTGADFGKDFKLVDTAGRTRTLADFRGKFLMMFFGFVQCPVVCPTALIRAVEVRRALGADANKLQVAFVTLDPERDTPEIIKSYTDAFDPDFIGLYSDLRGTEQVAKDFRVFYQKVPVQHQTLSQ